MTPTVARPNARPFVRPNYLLRHCVLDAYPGDLLDGVSGVEYYGARVLASSYPGDVIMMHPDLAGSPQLRMIQEHYSRCGLPTADEFIFDQNWELARGHRLQLNPFLFGDEANTVFPDPRFAATAKEQNNKNNFIRLCWSLGIPVPGTVLYDDPATFSLSDDRASYPVYVKAAVSASGMHVIRCENDAELLDAIAEMPGSFQIQEGLPPSTVFCSIQYVEMAGKFTHGPLTEQKLDGSHHAGNIFPARIVDADLVQPFTDKAARHMFEKGMRFTWGFDIAVTTDRGPLAIEANPRANGATYLWMPAARLDATAWEGEYVYPRNGDLRFILRDPADWEYSRHRGNGIVLINWGPMLGTPPKLGLLVIGDADQRERLLRTFKLRYC